MAPYDDASHPVVVARPTETGDAPQRLATVIPPVSGTILDLGAGAASWSIAMLRAWPDATAHVLDLPSGVGRTASAISAAGLTDRCDLIGADLWSVELDGGYEQIVIAGVDRLVEPPQDSALVTRAVRWLAPGGRLAIVSHSPDPEGGHPSTSTLLRWLVDAGLSDATMIDLGHPSLVAATATLEDLT